MKNAIYCFLMILISIKVYSQNNNWQLLTTTRALTSINFTSSNNGWVFGGDCAYKTTDSGLNWGMPVHLNVNVGGNYVSGLYARHVFFIDSLRGWATQNNSILLKTINGGLSWVTFNTNITSKYLKTIFFVNNQTGWVGGYDGSAGNTGVILKTTNGGNSWVVSSHPFNTVIFSIWMINGNYGFCNTSAGDSLAVTSDGGFSWTKRKIGNGQATKTIFFKDSLNGWILGDGYPAFISRTTNGGINWNVHAYSTNGNPNNIFFLNANMGWIVGSYGIIMKTTNGGINWNMIRSYQGGDPYFELYDVFFKNAETGWVTGHDGALLKTTDGGLNWNAQIFLLDGYVMSIDFINANTGWVYTGSVWKSTDRGYSWEKKSTIQNLHSIDFCNDLTGFACGDYGIVIKTTNSGLNWSQQPVDSFHYDCVKMLDVNTGYLCGSNGKILKSTNGGVNWILKQSNVTNALLDIDIIDAENIFVSGSGGTLLKTTNGAASWTVLNPSDTRSLKAVSFRNVSTGFVIGSLQNSSPLPSTNNKIIKTTNGGNSWLVVYNQTTSGFDSFNDIYFPNDNHGWVAIADDSYGYILSTVNGGNNWNTDYGPIGMNSTFTGGLFCISGINENYVWTGGFSSSIITKALPIGIQQISSELPNKFNMAQNYPNPFNPQTKIKFDVPSNVKGQTSNVKLVIYDLLGREVTTLVNEELRPGTYEADWDGSSYSSGVYFYKIITEDFVETKKMVLMK